MQLLSWLDGLKLDSSRRRTKRGQPRSPRRKPAGCKLAAETLEDRCQPSFLAPVNYAVGSSPPAVVSADFNNDAVLDLAVANSYDVSILLGNADGTFQPALASASGVYANSLAVGDFNADGKLDLVTAGNYGTSVLLGNGAGAFVARANINLGSPSASVAVGDFNGDGKLDLGVTTNTIESGYYNDYGIGNASVVLGHGDGTFATPNTTTLGYGVNTSAAVADFNGDGKLDFAATGLDDGTVNVLLGDGNGNLLGPTDFNASAGAVTAGDVNGDGKADLVTAGGDVSVLLGDGLGGFGAARNYNVGSAGISVVLGDFNHDSKLDIATGRDEYVSVLRGYGDGTFSPAVPSAAGDGAFAVAAGDFNGDGWLDAASANFYGNNVSVLINDRSWPPSVSVNDVTVTEGNTGTINATFIVTLSTASDVAVTVNYATADGTATAGSDYQPTSGILTFAPGETSKAVTVLVSGDRLAESDESFFVNLSNATNAVALGGGVGTIRDDEPYIGIVGYVNGLEGNTGTTPFSFSVTLSAAYDAPVTVTYATVDGTATAGSDYQAVSGTLTIPAGQTSGTINVLVNGDRLAEAVYNGGGFEHFDVNLTGSTSAHIGNATSYATVLDDEPRISIINNNVSLAEGNSGTQVMTFTVALSAAYDQAVTVNFATANGTAKVSDNDYVATSGTLTFAPGQTTKTFTVTIKGDTKKEADEFFYVRLSGASSNALIDMGYGYGNILNDDFGSGKGH